MNNENYKNKMIIKDMIRTIVIFITMIILVFIIIIVISNGERDQLYIEGSLKSSPLISNEAIRRLGDLYIKLNREFEFQIKEVETGYANRFNKKGDKIFYGVNGKENPDEMINDDYVNGIQEIKWQKGGAQRSDGESNFIDMITVLNTMLQTDIDRYDENIDEIFTNLFWMSHTFIGDSTELYPCKHGCDWIKYYCGDDLCQDRLQNGEVVGHFNTNIKYDPFSVNYKYYDELYNLSSSMSGGGSPQELFELFEAEGTCEVHGENKESWKSTTKNFRGCEISMFPCYHGEEIKIEKTEDGITDIVYYCPHGISNDPPTECTDFNDEYPYCPHECDCEGECEHEEEGPVGCSGYYCCNGHDHYFCKGHILCCCFGHTNLILTIKIMYYEEMLDEFKKILN